MDAVVQPPESVDDYISTFPPDVQTVLQHAPYLSGKGTAKFPLAQPIPYELITSLVQRLVAQRR